MNYLASGLEQGFAIGSAARQKKKDQEDREKFEAARRQFELDVQGKNITAQEKLQNDKLAADAARQFSQQGWQSGESDRDRGFRTSERLGTEGFTSGESSKQRDFAAQQAQLGHDATRILQQEKMAQDAKQFDATLPLHGAEVGLKARAEDWAESPTNPLNEYRAANAGMGMNPVQFNGGAPSPIGRPALSQQDQEAVNWARTNQNDPRAKAILQRLGISQ